MLNADEKGSRGREKKNICWNARDCFLLILLVAPFISCALYIIQSFHEYTISRVNVHPEWWWWKIDDEHLFVAGHQLRVSRGKLKKLKFCEYQWKIIEIIIRKVHENQEKKWKNQPS